MKLLAIAIFLLSCLSGYSQTDGFRSKEFNLDDGVAIKGYDPVAYFTMNKAVRGRKEFLLSSHGIIYHFASASDKELFQSNPSKYEPQYGGWCAYAMGHDGSKVEVDPETFKIVDGKLFLFYNKFFNNTLKSWNQNEAKLHTEADANWQKIIKKQP